MSSDTKRVIEVTEEKKSILAAMLMGTFIAYALTMIAFISCAILLRYTSFSEENVPLFVTITSSVSVMVSGFDVAKKASNKGWLWGMVSGVLYATILMLLGKMVSSNFSFDTRSITLFVLVIASGGLGGVIGINVKGSTK